jgi:archaellum component FlaC
MKRYPIKKLTTELQKLVDTYGYWSKEVLIFNSNLPYNISLKINQLIKR